MSIIVVPQRWTTNSAFEAPAFPNTRNHPFSNIAWLLSDRSSVISDMSSDQVDVINDIIDELENLEQSVIVEKSQKRAKRRAKVLKAMPLKENDENIQAAYHVAMLNRQVSTDDIPYETFKLLYDDITSILRSNK